MVVELQQGWYDSTWHNNMKITYTYDGNNNRIDRIYQDWQDSNWVNRWKDTYIYDENNFKIGNLEYYWDGSIWVVDGREIHTYDEENNNVIEWVWQILEGSNWVNWWKQIYKYDENNNHIETITLDPDGNNWVNTTRYAMTYDENKNRLDMLVQNWQAGNWWNSRKHTYTYEDITEVEQLTEGIKVYRLSNNYPNPFNPTTIISYSIPKQSTVTIKVFDVLGRDVSVLVNEEKPVGNYEVEFDASNLTSGVYFYRIQAGDFIDVKKMVLLK